MLLLAVFVSKLLNLQLMNNQLAEDDFRHEDAKNGNLGCEFCVLAAGAFFQMSG